MGALLRTFIADESSKHISVAKHGNTLIDLKNDGMVSLWNLTTDQPICTLDGRDFEFADWALSWNSQWFAGRNNNLVNVWRTDTGNLIYQFSLVPDLPHRPESKSYYPKPFPRNTLAIRGDGKAIIAIVFGGIKSICRMLIGSMSFFEMNATGMSVYGLLLRGRYSLLPIMNAPNCASGNSPMVVLSLFVMKLDAIVRFTVLIPLSTGKHWYSPSRRIWQMDSTLKRST